jgi:uncharacterized membrane protein YhaH (DUF805 family)
VVVSKIGGANFMGGLSIWHILILLIFGAIFLVPYAKILSRAGWSGWLCLLWLIPLLNIVMFWVFAFGRWPALDRNSD